jgi:hypothetical protein
MKSSIINRLLVGLTLVLASLQLVASGPENGRLSGKLLDGETNEPIPSANVVLLRASDQAFVRSVPTNADGSFRFENIPLGDYTVRTTVLGYQALKPVVGLSMMQGRVSLGTVVMQPLTRSLATRAAAKAPKATASNALPAAAVAMR